MYPRVLFLCVALSIVPSAVIAQQNTGSPATSADLDAFAMRIESKIEQLQKDYEARLKALEERFEVLADVQQSGQQALTQLAKTDKDGKSYPRIDATHEPTRIELRRAIEDTVPESGTVIIRNKTNATRAVSVNGTTYDVLAHSKRPIEVPYRRFEVRTCNNRTLSWDFSFPKTTAIVDINYATPSNAFTSNPGSTTYVQR